MSVLNTYTNFNQIITPSGPQTQLSFAPIGQLTADTSVAFPNLYGQSNRILSAHMLGTSAVLSDYYRVEVYGNTLSGTTVVPGRFGTLYASLAGSGAGVSAGAFLGAQLPVDCWLQVTPNDTIASGNNLGEGRVGMCVSYLETYQGVTPSS